MWPWAASALVVAALLLLWVVSGWLFRPPGGVTVCLVVRDQESRVEGLVGETLSWSSALGRRVREVLVVDAGSADATPDVLAQLSMRHPGLKIVRWSDDTWDEGSVLRAALASCGGEWLLLRRVTPGARSAKADEGGD